MDDTDRSIEHLKFERENRMLSTIKKSRNEATLSSKPKGEEIEEILIAEEHDENVEVNPRPLNNTIQTVNQVNSPKI